MASRLLHNRHSRARRKGWRFTAWLPLFNLVFTISTSQGLAEMVSAWRVARLRRNRAKPFC